mmetsp:Transcript_9180/g.12173  ORF Transcript_9180/g.12173 Transcript_9180/m.12173 type:complete len:645 (-) Transcript_9180:56-1990(-)
MADAGQAAQVGAPLPPHAETCSQVKMDVRVRLSIGRLIEVSLQGQTFTADLRMEASWVDPDIVTHLRKHTPRALPDEKALTSAWAADNLTPVQENSTETDQLTGCLRFKPLKGFEESSGFEDCDFFAPRLAFRNCVEMTNSRQWYTLYAVKGEEHPIVCLRWDFTGKFQEIFELRQFPMDVQALTMELCSYWEVDRESKYRVNLFKNQSSRYKSFVNTKSFVQQSEYSLSDRLRFKEDRSDPAESSSNKTYPLLNISMLVQRHVTYWVLNVVTPLFIITSCLFVSYATPYTEFADRCSMTLTLLLAMVAFKYVISEKLPPISYATLIDFYVLFCFVVAFLIILLQGLAAVEIVNEVVLLVPIEEGNVAWRAPDTNFLFALPHSRTAQVPFYLVLMSSIFLGLHVLGLFAWFAVWWWRHHRFDSLPTNVVWIGPVRWKDGERKRAEAELRGKVCKQLWPMEASDETLSNSAKEHTEEKFSSSSKDVLAVYLWKAEEAKGILWHGPLKDAEDAGDEKATRATAGRVSRVLRWFQSSFAREPEPYSGTRDFAVIAFRRAEDAARLIRKHHELDVLSYDKYHHLIVPEQDQETTDTMKPRRTIRMELLNPSWRVLSQRRGRLLSQKKRKLASARPHCRGASSTVNPDA